MVRLTSQGKYLNDVAPLIQVGQKLVFENVCNCKSQCLKARKTLSRGCPCKALAFLLGSNCKLKTAKCYVSWVCSKACMLIF